jgi:hypothetical protein
MGMLKESAYWANKLWTNHKGEGRGEREKDREKTRRERTENRELYVTSLLT